MLLSHGHSYENVFSRYTIKTLYGFSVLASKRAKVDMLNSFRANLIAARGTEKAVNKFEAAFKE